MKILLDLLPILPRGGGLQNARNLWRAVAEAGGEHRWLVLGRPGLGLQELAGAPHQELRLRGGGGSLGRVAAGLAGTGALARRWGADVILTPMGAGPLRAPVPSVMGWHDATVAYPELGLDAGGALARRLRLAYAARAARSAAFVCVQTDTMARRLARVWGLPEARFRVVPNGPSAFLEGEGPAPAEPPVGPRRILVPGDPKPAKNLEVVPAVAAALGRRGVTDVELALTVDAEPGPYGGPLHDALARRAPGVRVRLLGRVPHHAMGALYREAAVVLLPSLLESFSATYVEAFHFGVPLVTSDRDFARGVCGDAAVYAEPTDPDALAAALVRVLDDAALRGRLREAGFRRVATFPGWSDRLALYLAACRDAVEAAEGERAGAPSHGPSVGAAARSGHAS